MSTETTVIPDRSEAIRLLIADPIEATGEVPDARDAYDIEAIAATVLAWYDAYDEATNTYRMDQQGWTYAAPYSADADDDGAAFWAAVERNAL